MMDALTLRKANRFIKKVITKAERERDRKGYRENLGYDSVHVVEDYLKTLDLSYSEYCALKQEFSIQCDAI